MRPRSPFSRRKRGREKDSTKITTCTAIFDPVNVDSKLGCLLIRRITMQLERQEGGRERERDIGYLTRMIFDDIERERGQGRFETRISFTVCYEREIHARERSYHCLRGKIRKTSGIVVFVGRISRKDRSSSGVHMACRENSSGKRCKTTREERGGGKRSANKKRRMVYSRAESKYIYICMCTCIYSSIYTTWKILSKWKRQHF